MMSDPSALFTIDPRYCIDTNVIVSFLHEDDEEPYRRDAFADQWDRIEQMINSGEIVAPRRVELELVKWEKEIPSMKGWLAKRGGMFVDMTTEQLVVAKRIVNDFPAYGSSDNYIADLEVMSLASTRALAVVTNERVRPTMSLDTPKIPEVCGKYGIECLSVSGFLAREMPKRAS
ncbi:DUF4411 family protein [Protaetiibacter sp. SSC-01]|uniref:DUF4411 family protein n=1 Tax=Protaetiibacter sp. SSC-01 TaxID=2759943 RepID=UPI001656C951|nr:DUF4411 family protein [Protaetiibacter sp. SSC-01]QNO38653.1 DUF4411 family protein [Protaetiibacter sp. SSC-01]